MLHMALEFGMNNKLWKFPFYTESCSLSFCLWFVIGQINVGDTGEQENLSHYSQQLPYVLYFTRSPGMITDNVVQNVQLLFC